MNDEGKNFVRTLIIGTSVWTLVMFGWFFKRVSSTPNLLNVLLMCVIAVTGMIWLQWYLHLHTLRIEREETRVKDTKNYRALMGLWLILLVLLLLSMLLLAMWAPNRLFVIHK